jgi:hypothetical protein
MQFRFPCRFRFSSFDLHIPTADAAEGAAAAGGAAGAHTNAAAATKGEHT